VHLGGEDGIAIVGPWERGGCLMAPHRRARFRFLDLRGTVSLALPVARVCVAASSKMWVRELRVPLWAARTLFGKKIASPRDF
jgi:hypothetical protein